MNYTVPSSISCNMSGWSLVERTSIVHFQGWTGIRYEIGSNVISYMSAKYALGFQKLVKAFERRTCNSIFFHFFVFEGTEGISLKVAPPFQAQGRLPLAVNRNPIVLSVRREEYLCWYLFNGVFFWGGGNVFSHFSPSAHILWLKP